MPSRLVLNELDIDLAPLTAWLVVIIVVVVLRSLGDARTLHATILCDLTTVALGELVIVVLGRVDVLAVLYFAHVDVSSR